MSNFPLTRKTPVTWMNPDQDRLRLPVMCAKCQPGCCMDYCLDSALCNNVRSLVSPVIWQPHCVTVH